MNTSQSQDKALFLQPTVQAISTVLGFPSCIWLLDEATNAFQVAAAAELSQEYINTITLPLDERSVATEVYKTGKTIIVEDIAADNRWRSKAEALDMGWKSAVVTPLWLKRKIGGILDIYIPEGIIFDVDEKMPIIDCFAGQISAALRQVQGLETLNEVASLINVVTDHNSNLFELILQSVQKVLDCKRVSIFLVDKSGDLVLEAASTVQIKRERFKPGEGLAWQVVETKKTLLVPDARQYPQFVPGLSSNTEERSMLLSPLFFQSNCIGVISADIDGINGFDEYDLRLMETLSGQIAIAIHNVRLFQSEQERIEEIERLRQIEQILNSNIDFEKVVEAALDELDNVVEFNTASVQLIRGDHRFLIGAKGFSIDDSSPKLLRNLTDDPLIHKIVESRKVFILSNISNESLWEHIPETFSVYSWIAAPLFIGDQVIGLLTIDHSKPGYYTEEDGKKIAKFANQVAAAIHESSFFQLIRNQAEALTELNKLTYGLLSIEETPDIRKLLTNIAEIAKKVLNADLLELYEYWQDRNTYTLPQISVGKRLKPLVTTEKKIYEDSSIFQLIQRQDPLYAESVEVEPICSTPYSLERKDLPTERFIVREKIRSTAAIPLRTGKESMGLMFASYRTPQTFSKELREIIELFAAQAAIAIKNARLYSGVNLKRKALVEIGQSLTAGIRLHEHEVLELIYRQASEKLGMHNLTIAFYDKTTNTVRFALGTVNGRRVDVEKEPGWEPRQRGNGKTERIIHSKQYLLLSTQEKVKEMGFSPVPGHKDYEGTLPNSWLGVPMSVEGKVLGVIANYDYGQDNLYGEDDVEILQALAAQAAIALENVQLYNSLKESERKYRMLVEQALDMIIATDMERRIVEFNGAAQKIFGYCPEEVLGKHVNILYANETEALAVSHTMDEQGHCVREILNKRKDGGTFSCLLSASILQDARGNQIGIMGISRDITDRKRTEEELEKYQEHLEELVKKRTAELEKANEELKELDRRKSEFLSTVSHELRTPLTPIKAYLEGLLSEMYGTITVKQKVRADIALACVNEEARLVEKLLNLVLIEEDRVGLDYEYGNVADVVYSIMKIYEYDAKEKGIELKAKILNEDRLATQLDRGKIKEVLTNLVDNALKFTSRDVTHRDGCVTVSVHSENNWITVCVNDAGIGIPEGQREKIFDRFYQVDSSLTRKVGGTGIGLNIAKKYVELHDGEIWVDSEPDVGSTFTFTLPIIPKES